MKVNIEGNFYLESDSMNFIVKEYTGKVSVDEKSGKETELYNTHGYYPTVHSALKAFMVMKIKESTAADLKGLIADIRRIEEWLKSTFEIEIKEGEKVAV